MNRRCRRPGLGGGRAQATLGSKLGARIPCSLQLLPSGWPWAGRQGFGNLTDKASDLPACRLVQVRGAYVTACEEAHGGKELVFVVSCHKHSCWLTHEARGLGEFPFQIRLGRSFSLESPGAGLKTSPVLPVPPPLSLERVPEEMGLCGAGGWPPAICEGLPAALSTWRGTLRSPS